MELKSSITQQISSITAAEIDSGTHKTRLQRASSCFAKPLLAAEPGRAERHRTRATSTLLACRAKPQIAHWHQLKWARYSSDASRRVSAGAGGAQRRDATLFARSWTAAEGLGPEFNARGCAAWHFGRDEAPLVVSSSSVTDATGGHVFARFRVDASGAVEQHAIPTGASLRRAPALEGLDLLERVAASEIVSRADPDDANGDGISGRIPSGRFG